MLIYQTKKAGINKALKHESKSNYKNPVHKSRGQKMLKTMSDWFNLVG